jgi:8-oxo-dGTP pyrophosphatase MutT (NUDIX family)
MVSSDVRAVPLRLAGPSIDCEDVSSVISVSNRRIESINRHASDNDNQERTTDIAAWTFRSDFSLVGLSDSAALFTAIEASDIPANLPEEGSEDHIEPSTIPAWHTDITQEQRESMSRRANVEASQLVAARETRNKERIVIDDRTGSRIRLVAGCVPILRDGRVILVGSRKGNEWFGLPKGGWESDETLEEAAIRESFEEAGVLGILGPRLPSFLVKSGKGKCKRLEAEQTAGNSPSSVVTPIPDRDDCANGVHYCELSAFTPQWDEASNGDRRTENSMVSEKQSRTHTCVTFFPLYVLEVKETWPENSRNRNAYPIEGKLLNLSVVVCLSSSERTSASL